MTTAMVCLVIVIGIVAGTLLAVLKNSTKSNEKQREFLENLVYKTTTGNEYQPSLTTMNQPTASNDQEIWNGPEKWNYPTQGLDPTLDTLSRENQENEMMAQSLARMRAYDPNNQPDPGLDMEMDRAGMFQDPDLIPPHIREILNQQD